jgi:hypothetical protein
MQTTHECQRSGGFGACVLESGLKNKPWFGWECTYATWFNLTINKQEAHPVMTNAFAIYTHNLPYWI